MSEKVTPQQRVQKRDQYRTWINWAAGIGVAGFSLAYAVWWVTDASMALYAGLGIYWLGCLGMGLGYWASPVSVRDEFEQQLVWEASQVTYAFVAFVTIFGIPADAVLTVTGTYTPPAVITGALWGYLLLVFIFGGAHWYVKRQYD